MGQIKYFKVSFLLIILTVVIYIIAFGDYQSIRRNIYFKHNSKICFGYFLGYLPSDYELNYDESNLHSDDKFDLINIVHNKFPVYHNYIIFNDKIEKEQFLLKDSDMFYKKIEGRSNLLSSQINLNCFNKLVKYKSLKNQDSVMEYYFYLLSELRLDSYRKIANQNELLDLAYNSKLFTNKFDEDLIFDLNKILNYSNYSYCWFKNLGLFEINFTYEGLDIKNISDKFLGYIGNEEN